MASAPPESTSPEAGVPPRPLPRRRRRGVLWGLWVAWTLLGTALVMALGLDLALRAMFAAKDALMPLPDADPRLVANGYDGADWVGDYFVEMARVEADYSPYVGFRVTPFAGRFIHVDDDGTRRTRNVDVEPDAAPREVLVLGGSAAWGMGARDEQTIPSRLAETLAARGHSVHVTNLAQIGHVSSQDLLMLMSELRDGRRPEVVLFYHGVNDVLAAAQSGEAGVPQNESNRRAEFNILQSPARLAGGLVRYVARESALSRIAGSIARRLGLPDSSQGAAAGFDEALAEAVARSFTENIRIIEALAADYQFTPVYYWQPVIYGKRQTDYEREKAAQYAWLERPFALVNARIHALDAEMVPADRFHDLTHILDDSGDLLFIDFCHTTEAANRMIASAIADDIEPLLGSRQGVPDRPQGPSP